MGKFTITKKQAGLIITGLCIGGYYIYKRLKEKPLVEKHTVTVTKKDWVRKDHINAFVKETDSGFEVPSGAYDIRSEKRLKKSGTVQFTDAVNFSYPVYDTYYIYSVNRWSYMNTVSVGSSENQSSSDVYLSAPKIDGLMPKDKVIPEIGDLTIASTEVFYYIYGTDDQTGEMVRIRVNKLIYDSLTLGGGQTAKVSMDINRLKKPKADLGVVKYDKPSGLEVIF